MYLDSIFIINCNITLHVSGVFCIHPQEYLKTSASAEANDLGRPYWILHPTS
jgi:hypothetical protein